MSVDKEVEEINQKKLKAKGAKIVEKQQAVNYETVVMQLSQYLNARGLEMMNMSNDLRDMVANERQRLHSKINQIDSQKE